MLTNCLKNKTDLTSFIKLFQKSIETNKTGPFFYTFSGIHDTDTVYLKMSFTSV